jgi:hypothetical protein
MEMTTSSISVLRPFVRRREFLLDVNDGVGKSNSRIICDGRRRRGDEEERGDEVGVGANREGEKKRIHGWLGSPT